MSKAVTYVDRKAGRGSPRLLAPTGLLSSKPVWAGMSSGVTPSLIPISDRPEYYGEPRGEDVEHFDVEFDPAARSFGLFWRELQDKYFDMWTLVGTLPLTRTDMELGVERKIVVRMSPLSSRDVKVRTKTVRRAKPNVVFDPVSGD